MSQKNTAQGAASLYFSNLLALFVITGHFIILTNNLSPTEIGIIFAFQIIMYGLSTIANFALPIPIMSPLPLPHSITKFIPNYLSNNQKEKANFLFRYSLVVVFLISILLLILFIFKSELFINQIFQQEISQYLIVVGAIQILFFTLNQFFFYGLVSISKSYQAGIVQIISVFIRYSLAGIFVIFNYGILGVFVGYLIGDIVFTIIAIFLCRSLLTGKTEKVSFNKIFNYSIPILISSFIIFGVTQIDRIFALLNLGLPDLGIYTIAIAASTIGSYAPNALATAITPTLAKFESLKKTESFRSLSKLYTRYVSFIGIPAAFMIASLSLPLTALFGEEYIASSIPAAIISISIGLTAFSSIYNSQLFVKGETRWIMISNIAGLMSFIIIASISQLLNNNITVIDLAIGRAVMVIITAGLISYKAYKFGDMKYDKKAIINSLVSSIIMASVLFILYNLVFNSLELIISLIILIPLGIIMYIFILRQLHTFNKQDSEFIIKIISKKSAKNISIIEKILGIKNEQ